MNEGFEQQLRAAVRGDVRFDTVSRRIYATDASLYEILPQGVVVPRDREDLETAASIALAAGVPVLMRGGGTSLAGQTVGDCLVIDCSAHCNRLLEIDAEAGWARVQPGIVLDDLNAALAKHGLFFPIDPATSAQCTLGGMIANNSAGAHSVLYGMTTDHVLELDVMLGDGVVTTLRPLAPGRLDALCNEGTRLGGLCREVRRIVSANRDEIDRRFPKIMRRVSGYSLDRLAASGDAFDLTQLVVGSEGTLAVILEAKLKLSPLPRAKGLTVIHFDSLADSVKCVPTILATGPSAVELTDRNLMDQTRDSLAYKRMRWWIQDDPAATLIVEYYADSAEEVAEKIKAIKHRLAAAGVAGPYSDAVTAAQQADVWAVRKAGLGLLLATPGRRKATEFLEDCSVPVERLPEYCEQWSRLCADEGTHVAFYAHASVGVLHIRPFLDLTDPADVQRMTRIAEKVTDMVARFGGSISGEHGDGLSRSGWLGKVFGPQLLDAFAQVKKAFDPAGLLNPGKIVRPPPMTDNWRFGPGDSIRVVQTGFDYTREGGFAEAVLMCNGQGLCRKDLTGTMCPSYMVTRDEEQTTRGRANALREMLAGRLDESWDSDRIAAVLDLCLSCKGCKGECPSNVDLAKLKAEFLYQRFKKRGRTPLKAKLFGHVELSNKWGSWLAPLSNLFWSSRLTRALFTGPLGIDSRRTMPRYAYNNLLRWWKRRQHHKPDTGVVEAGCRQVVLFPDCFVTYNEPELGKAAVRVLEAAGFEVVLGPKVCCGRAMLSRGLLDDARATLAKLLDAYGELIDAGLPILGIEPSCILTFRDELLSLHPGDDRAKALARQSFMIEEFLAAEADADRLRLPLRQADGPILLHGHCHAKALVGTGPTERMLRLIPGAKVSVADSGCCGMAGSFGYEKGHYEISMAIGEHRLFPAVREAVAAGSLVAAAGTSCRHQIHDGTAARPRHPIVLLADHLAAAPKA